MREMGSHGYGLELDKAGGPILSIESSAHLVEKVKRFGKFFQANSDFTSF